MLFVRFFSFILTSLCFKASLIVPMNHISGALSFKNTRLIRADAAVKRFYLYIFFLIGGPEQSFAANRPQRCNHISWLKSKIKNVNDVKKREEICVRFGTLIKSKRSQAVEKFDLHWRVWKLESRQVRRRNRRAKKEKKKSEKSRLSNLTLTSVKYKLGCGRVHATLSHTHTHSIDSLLLTLAQWDKGAHLKPITPLVIQHTCQKHTHTPYQHHESRHCFSRTSLFADKMHLHVSV